MPVPTIEPDDKSRPLGCQQCKSYKKDMIVVRKSLNSGMTFGQIPLGYGVVFVYRGTCVGRVNGCFVVRYLVSKRILRLSESRTDPTQRQRPTRVIPGAIFLFAPMFFHLKASISRNEEN